MSKDKTELKRRITEEDDFIYCPRLSNSLTKFMDKHPNGVENERIAKVLLMTTDEVEEAFQSAIVKLRSIMGIDV